MTGFEQLGERVIHDGPVFSVSIGEIRTPDGQILKREYVRHPGAVVIVPIVAGNEVVLVRQYRAAIARPLLEIPAGKRDVGDEPPAVTAARELREEVGLEAGQLTLMSSFYNTPGFCDEFTYCYLATDCTPVPSDRQGAEEEHMTIEQLPLAEAIALAVAGDIDDGKTLIGLLLAQEHLAHSSP